MMKLIKRWLNIKSPSLMSLGKDPSQIRKLIALSKAYLRQTRWVSFWCRLIDCELGLLRWLILHKFTLGKRVLPTIIRLREAKDRIQNGN